MPFDQRKRYMQLHDLDRWEDRDIEDVVRIIVVKCFDTEHAAANFSIASWFNRCRLFTVDYSWSWRHGEMIMRSMIDILNGDEMIICYILSLLLRSGAPIWFEGL